MQWNKFILQYDFKNKDFVQKIRSIKFSALIFGSNELDQDPELHFFQLRRQTKKVDVNGSPFLTLPWEMPGSNSDRGLYIMILQYIENHIFSTPLSEIIFFSPYIYLQ